MQTKTFKTKQSNGSLVASLLAMKDNNLPMLKLLLMNARDIALFNFMIVFLSIFSIGHGHPLFYMHGKKKIENRNKQMLI